MLKIFQLVEFVHFFLRQLQKKICIFSFSYIQSLNYFQIEVELGKGQHYKLEKQKY